MCDKNRLTARLGIASFIGFMLLITSPADARVQAIAPSEFVRHQVNCETPVRLAHDCSIWAGATRPIAFGRYRMLLAAGSDGRTILVSRLRPRPDHNGSQFSQGLSDRLSGARVIRLIGSALEDQGLRLERLQPIRNGQRIDAWFLEFSGDAYNYLKQFTVLESEYWLPDNEVKR